MTTLTLALLFQSATQQFNLPPGLLAALCFVESKHVATAVHHDDGGSDSLGICQIKYKTAQWLGFQGTEQELMQPKINIYYAAKVLVYQADRYGGDYERAVVAYNRGNAKGLQRSEYSCKVFKAWEGMQ
jgi:soluble lytic murein transglycosylase-like protein